LIYFHGRSNEKKLNSHIFIFLIFLHFELNHTPLHIFLYIYFFYIQNSKQRTEEEERRQQQAGGGGDGTAGQSAQKIPTHTDAQSLEKWLWSGGMEAMRAGTFLVSVFFVDFAPSV